MAAAVHGDPHLSRKLGRQLMERQGRKQAEHRLRHFGGHSDQAFMLGSLTAGQPVDAAPGLLKLAVGCHACEDDPGCPDCIQIAGAQDALLLEQIKDALAVGVGSHCGHNMFHIFVERKYMTNLRNNPAAGALSRFATNRGRPPRAFTASITLAGDEIQSGMVGINSVAISTAETPFGGVKESGYGSEAGLEGIEDYLNVKLISRG
jgi:hypothetical protein